MDKLNAIESFIRVVEEGSFAAAARKLGTGRSTVHKAVTGLEEMLATTLFQRSTRSVTLTEAGRSFYNRVQPVVADFEQVLQSTQHQEQTATGLLRINAPVSFGRREIGPIVARFMRHYPELKVELSLTDRAVDTIEEGFDVTLKFEPELQHSTALVCQPLYQEPVLLCAAPSYIAKSGEPADLEALKQHRCLFFSPHGSGDYWRFNGETAHYQAQQGQAGESKTQRKPAHADEPNSVHVQPVMRSNNGEVLVQAAVAGNGIAMIPQFLARERLQRGELIRILVEQNIAAREVFALYPRHRFGTAKIKLFIEFLVAEIADAHKPPNLAH